MISRILSPNRYQRARHAIKRFLASDFAFIGAAGVFSGVALTTLLSKGPALFNGHPLLWFLSTDLAAVSTLICGGMAVQSAGVWIISHQHPAQQQAQETREIRHLARTVAQRIMATIAAQGSVYDSCYLHIRERKHIIRVLTPQDPAYASYARLVLTRSPELVTTLVPPVMALAFPITPQMHRHFLRKHREARFEPASFEQCPPGVHLQVMGYDPADIHFCTEELLLECTWITLPAWARSYHWYAYTQAYQVPDRRLSGDEALTCLERACTKHAISLEDA